MPGSSVPKDVGNLAIVPLSADGKINVLAGGNDPNSGAEVIIDVLGYIDTAVSGVNSGGTFSGLAAPQRLYDSRSNTPAYPGSAIKGVLAANSTRTINATALPAIPKAAKSVLVRVTTVETSGGGFLALYAGPLWYGTASVNTSRAGQQIGNLVVVGLDSGNFLVRAGSNASGFVLDILGYIA